MNVGLLLVQKEIYEKREEIHGSENINTGT